MLNARWRIPKCRNPDVMSRYQPSGCVMNSPSPVSQRIGSASTSLLSPRSRWAVVTWPVRAPVSPVQTMTPMKTRTLAAISAYVTRLC